MKKQKNPGRKVPNKVKEFRDEQALTRHRLAGTAGIAYSTLCKMEEGIPVRKDCRIKVAKALSKKYEEVFPNNTD